MKIEILAMIDHLSKGLNMTKEEILKFALAIYHPQVLIDAGVEDVKIVLFFNKTDMKMLGTLAKRMNMSEVEVVKYLLENPKPDYTELLS